MKTVVHRVPITKARINLGQLVRRAHANREYFILEKDGIPVAGVMNADEMEDFLDLQDPGLKDQIRKSYQAYRRGGTRDAGSFLGEISRSTKRSKR
jgi:antitoxin (DNA-binding transcriptional repressor) of toxin-antitoxin stability system